MPVFPEVASITVCPGFRMPLCSASMMIANAVGPCPKTLVKGLDFDVQINMIGTRAIQSDHRRVSYRFQNIVIDHCFVLVISGYLLCLPQNRHACLGAG